MSNDMSNNMSSDMSALPGHADNLWAPPVPGSAPTPPPPPPVAPAAPSQGYGAPAPSERAWPLATWGARVLAYLIDSALLLVGWIPYLIGVVMVISNAPTTTASGEVIAASPDSTSTVLAGLLLIVLGGLLSFGIWLWNRVFRMGRTGQSVGKRVMRLYLVAERTGNPMGAGMCFVREIAHYVDGILYLGYLWPLWDDKRQTFADKIVSTVVAQAPAPLA